ncbi:MAG: class II aldolase/adducin family protein [Acidobacteriaceae bacterium]
MKQEIVRAGKKLWQRQYVDGNGGNISVRVSPQYVLCTPTLCSKADLCLEDFSLVDLDNCQICGDRPQTSEILLHLEIYKAVPAAKAVIHCHPPYATAHAVAGVVPQGNLIPEQEVFIGPVALAPYETPGTRAFARTVLPFVQDHNTILLANHGIVCWADTVTHAEWYVEVIDNYCKTVLIASQLRPRLNEIPPDKIVDLLAIKQKLGLPDPRLRASDESIEMNPVEAGPSVASAKNMTQHETDELIRRLTAEVDAFIDRIE